MGGVDPLRRQDVAPAARDAAVSDPALAGLAVALDPRAMARRLAALLGPGEVGNAGHFSVEEARVVKHRPGRRCAIVYTLRGSSGRLRLFAKAFAGERGASVLEAARRIAERAPGEALLVPRPLGYLADLRLLVGEYLEGAGLATALYAGTSETPARRMAAALAALHRCAIAGLRRWTAADEVRNTKGWVSTLAGRPGLASRARALLGRFELASRDLLPEREDPIHRDFYPEQVLDCAGRTALVDLDDARQGDRAVDVGNFLAHLVLRPAQFPETASGCGRAREAFLDEYLAAASAAPAGRAEERRGLERRIRLYEAVSLLRLAGVYAARPRWAGGVPPRMIEACEERLEGEGMA